MTEKTKKIIKITALGLCAAVLTVAVLAFLAFPRTSRASMQVEAPSDLGGMTVEETDGDVVSLAAVEISPEDFADYGFMPIAEKAYTLTATVNDDATVKAVDWTIEFQNPASEWARGKTVTDYVSFSSKGDLTATVACSQAFGEPILVSAVSRDNPAVKATCTCDYQKQIIGVDFSATSNVSEHSISQKSAPIGSNLGKIYFGDTYSLHAFSAEPVYGIGTKAVGPQVTMRKLTFSVPSEACAKLAQAGYLHSDMGQNEVTFDYPFDSLKFDDDDAFALFGPGFLSDRVSLANAIRTLNSAIGRNHFTDFLKATLTFVVIGNSYDGPLSFDFYFNIDADSLLTPVSSVELDQQNLLF